MEGKKYRVRMNVTLAEHNRAAIPKLREFLKHYLTESHMYYYRLGVIALYECSFSRRSLQDGTVRGRLSRDADTARR